MTDVLTAIEDKPLESATTPTYFMALQHFKCCTMYFANIERCSGELCFRWNESIRHVIPNWTYMCTATGGRCRFYAQYGDCPKTQSMILFGMDYPATTKGAIVTSTQGGNTR